MIHRLADCMCENIPESTNIWQFCVVFPKAQIGENCNICSHCLIENEVKIGNNCTVKCGVQLWNGIELEDNVMIGANCTFNKDWKQFSTKICRGASIGAGSTILPGLIIGSHAMIGAGSVVTKNIPKNTIWIGNPAQMKGYITKDNITLDLQFRDKQGNIHDYSEINY
jgi:UDP-2-acetamido-3-amino-2,3-dideoxy-glucuronate N-acetyltransferase